MNYAISAYTLLIIGAKKSTKASVTIAKGRHTEKQAKGVNAYKHYSERIAPIMCRKEKTDDG